MTSETSNSKLATRIRAAFQLDTMQRGGLAAVLLGTLTMFLVMSHEGHIRIGNFSLGGWLGLTGALLAAAGFTALLGHMQSAPLGADAEQGINDWRSTWLGARPGMFGISPLITLPLALAIMVLGAFAFGNSGMPWVIVVALLIVLVSALSRPGLLVFTLISLILLPCLGIYGLWDPWETHYGEVAREILSRDDWISLWWAHEEWFWSKPIFIFWSEALSMLLMGFNYRPDGFAVGNVTTHPEWAVRMPHYLLATFTCVVVYHAIAKRFGKRTGLVTALVLGTLPHFFMLSHQAITDMPFVSNMTMAIAMLALAITEDPESPSVRIRFGRITLNGNSFAIFTLALVALPQIFYLITRNVSWIEGGFAWHLDRFNLGSAGNGGNPGNPLVREIEPAFNSLAEQPITQALYWLVGFVVVANWLRKEQRLQGLYMYAFYVFCAFSMMAKGLPGVVLPAIVAFFYLIGSRRWHLLTHGQFRIAMGLITVLVVGMPWYVAMYIRHGKPFTDRLLIHDHINRLTAGVHGDTGSIQYFMEQLGFGLFPWIALGPLAIGGWIALQRSQSQEPESVEADRRKQQLLLFGLWGTSAFTLFSAMTTKFHHYIFPAVPSCGILVGIALERLLARSPRAYSESVRANPNAFSANPKSVLSIACAALAPVGLVLGVAGLAGDPRGIVPADLDSASRQDWVLNNGWPVWLSATALLLGVAFFVGAYVLSGGSFKLESNARRGTWVGATTALLAAPLLVGLVGRDLSWATARPHGFERLIHLFVYNYERSWPEQFDYRPILTGFAAIAALLIGLAAITRIRREALFAFMGLAGFFAVWCLDVYLIDLAPHWSQRNMYDRYYEQRQEGEPILAWLMNWKGENFYTGNRVYTFVDTDNRKFNEWVQAHQGQKVWIVTELGRAASLRAQLSGTHLTDEVTVREQSHFIMMSGVLGRATPGASPNASVRGTPVQRAQPTSASGAAAPAAPMPPN